MATRLALRTHHLPFAIFTANRFLPKHSLPKPSQLHLFSTISCSLTLSFSPDFPYGPSIHKGKLPYQSHLQQLDHPQPSPNLSTSPNQQQEQPTFNKDLFTRVFEVAAIRVPAENCFALENQLRGHLLNWPRVRNIARVPGDEMDNEFRNILPEKRRDEDGVLALDRRMYGKAEGDGENLSPVLYREELANSFNARGYLNFKNLAKITRPQKRKKVKEEEGLEEEKRVGKADFVTVEVVEDKEDDMRGLLGDEFRGGSWGGSTRLLLLDERYAGKSADELPEAIKVFVPSL